MSEKQRVKTRTILDAAERLFLDLGYVGTTMDAVANEAAVTKQTVYRYFPSKADLVAALVRGFDGEGARFTFGDETLEEELLRYGNAFLTRHMTARNLGFFRLMLAESREHAELGEIFRSQAQPKWHGVLSAFLADRLDAATVSVDEVAHLFHAMLSSPRTAVLMGNRPPLSEAEIASHTSLVVSVFLDGVCKTAKGS
ncbi:TetR/AcrR family transcriptional regulator [uncultured Cohaesibacter sp.]|uniref:TetR/AcrR family transcriptional regulator n=1 Tax=uncultured Cohaesibacter sp. TaxID=1002546 RepID=UPI0029C80DB2|nr:TetR/AcrR family transcriptional regulator [uncultured Cohaesibacter sp.]